MQGYPPSLSDTIVGALAAGSAQTAIELYAHLARGPSAEVLKPSEAAHHASDVLQRAKETPILIDDSPTLCIQSWRSWRVEETATELVGRLAERGSGVSELRDRLGPIDLSPYGGFAQEVTRIVAASAHEAPEADFRATELHRNYRRVFDAARDHAVFVGHRQTLLAVDLWRRRRFGHTVLSVLFDIRQFHAAYARNHNEPAVSWASMTPYPWIAGLPSDEVDDFARDLLPYFVESVRREDLDGFFGYLRGWQTACTMHGNREIRERLGSEIDVAQLLEIGVPDTE